MVSSALSKYNIDPKRLRELEKDYVTFRVYKQPEKPTEYGEFVFSTPVILQAITGVIKAEEDGVYYFIKGVKPDGTEVLFI